MSSNEGEWGPKEVLRRLPEFEALVEESKKSGFFGQCMGCYAKGQLSATPGSNAVLYDGIGTAVAIRTDEGVRGNPIVLEVIGRSDSELERKIRSIIQENNLPFINPGSPR